MYEVFSLLLLQCRQFYVFLCAYISGETLSGWFPGTQTFSGRICSLLKTVYLSPKRCFFYESMVEYGIVSTICKPNLFRIFRIGYLYTYWVPLGFVMSVTLIREAIDDIRRWQRDREVNNSRWATGNNRFFVGIFAHLLV
jgi:hypothetical protein